MDFKFENPVLVDGVDIKDLLNVILDFVKKLIKFEFSEVSDYIA